MKKIMICLVAVVSLVSSCYSQPKVKTVVSDANAVVRNVSSFNAIQVSQAIQVYLSQGSEDAVAISCSDASKNDDVKTEVKNGNLRIYLDQGFWDNMTGSNLKIKAYVTMKNITAIHASGASSVKINEAINCNDLNIKLSGASSCKGNVTAKNLTVKVSGASTLNLTGKADETTLDCSGASTFKSYDFITTKCKVDAAGASSVNIGVTNELKVDAAGASSVKYAGSPSIVNSDVSGASSVKKKD